MKFLLFLFLLLCGSIVLQAKDRIILKDGTQITGTITSISDHAVSIKRNGSIVTIESSQISQTLMDNPPEIKSLLAYGATLGNPGVINFSVSYTSEYFHTRGMLGAGSAIIVGFPVFASQNIYMAPSLTGGFFPKIEKKYYYNEDYPMVPYFACGFDCYIHGFTMFLGFNGLVNSTDQGVVIFDIGYQFSWN